RHDRSRAVGAAIGATFDGLWVSTCVQVLYLGALMRWRLGYVAGAVVLTAAAGVVLAACSGPGQRRAAATSAAAAVPAADPSSRSPIPLGVPPRDLSAGVTVAVDGSVTHRGGVPLVVEVGRSVRLDVSVAPKLGTQIIDLQLGIAGPGSWGDEGSVH